MSNLDVEMAEVIVNLEKENASLKNELIKECKEHQEAMQIADKRIKELEKQLAEKEEENLALAHIITGWDDYNQEKIEFAIEQLEEIKKLFEKKYLYDVQESDFAIIYELDIDEIIDNQINKLKGAINE